MRCHDVAKAREDGLGATGILRFPFAQHLLDLDSLHVLLRPAQRAGNQRELTSTRVALDVTLGHIGEWPDDNVPAVFRSQLRRHGLELAAEKHVQKQSLDDVVAMVTQGDLCHTVLGGVAIQSTATQS